jgi:hypothetical protein
MKFQNCTAIILRKVRGRGRLRQKNSSWAYGHPANNNLFVEYTNNNCNSH